MKTSVDRVQELDVLRGIAIIGMVLSGSIAFGGILPAWMYHAQVPPPTHQFDPNRPGITWVDLVFPLFLFCMGAAIPLSLKIQLDKGLTRFSLFSVAVRRFFQLLFFALFSQQSIVDANVTANYNNALNLYNNKAYAAAQKIFKTVEEKTKINSALKVDASYYNAICAIKLNQTNADKKVLTFVEENPTQCMLDESASDSFANAKNCALGGSGRPKKVTIYRSRLDTNRASDAYPGDNIIGIKSSNVFNLERDN